MQNPSPPQGKTCTVLASQIPQFLETAVPEYDPNLQITVIWDLEAEDVPQDGPYEDIAIKWPSRPQIPLRVKGDSDRTKLLSNLLNLGSLQEIEVPESESKKRALAYTNILCVSLPEIVPYLPNIAKYEDISKYDGPVKLWNSSKSLEIIGAVHPVGFDGFLPSHGSQLTSFNFEGPSLGHLEPGLCFACFIFALAEHCPELKSLRLRSTADYENKKSFCFSGRKTRLGGPDAGPPRYKFHSLDSWKHLESIEVTICQKVVRCLDSFLSPPRLNKISLYNDSYCELDQDLKEHVEEVVERSLVVPKKPKKPKESEGSKEPKESEDSKDPKDSEGPQEPKESGGSKESKDPWSYIIYTKNWTPEDEAGNKTTKN
ncbi:hypothetical protein TWF481_006221 [Arthrobotrys musiformis]|uniref:Uncharacterized protein n=1 Tax=Arthrobotrys musiformis TaxID=47236 RepID=A0AAV9WG15_9PEZI